MALVSSGTYVSSQGPVAVKDQGPTATTTWALSPLDQYMSNIYVRLMYFISFEDVSAEGIHDATSRLCMALDASLDRWPFLAGMVCPAPSTTSAGAVQLKYQLPRRTAVAGERHRHPDPGIFRTQMVWYDDWPHRYDDFVSTGGPDPSMCQKEIFSISVTHPLPGEVNPPLTLTASFLEHGGLVLCFAFHHAVFDGASISMFLEEFAANVRSYSSSRPGE